MIVNIWLLSLNCLINQILKVKQTDNEIWFHPNDIY